MVDTLDLTLTGVAVVGYVGNILIGIYGALVGVSLAIYGMLRGLIFMLKSGLMYVVRSIPYHGGAFGTYGLEASMEDPKEAESQGGGG